MNSERQSTANSFDARAQNYARNTWHKISAERLVELCNLQLGASILDACTGTGFAAIAAARAVGLQGRVWGVDISAGMLGVAATAIREMQIGNVELIEGDVTKLEQFGDQTVDGVICAAGLLYLPIETALREWRRVLKENGFIAFSSMEAGSPLAARIFRACAAKYGVVLQDPSESLGTPASCKDVLVEAGCLAVDVVSETVDFGVQDMSLAWESNFGAAVYWAVQRLGKDEQEQLKRDYLESLSEEERNRPGLLRQAGILYAIGKF